jgi:hypothetical protein
MTVGRYELRYRLASGGGSGCDGAGGAVYVQALPVSFTGTLDANGGLGGIGRSGGGSGGRGGANGTGGQGGDGGRDYLRVVSPMFNNAVIVRGTLRHNLL